MEFCYRPTEYELKLSVLYVIDSLKVSATAYVLNAVMSAAVKTSYFEVGHITYLLMEDGEVEELTIDGQAVFSITPKGKAAIGYFYHSIPFSVREKLLKKAEEINRQAKRDAEVIAECVPVNHREYMASLKISESGDTLLRVDLNTGSLEMAQRVASHFKKNHEEIYHKILEILTGDLS